MNTGTNRSGFPQWTFKENSFFDKIAVWIDKTFYGSPYNLTTEKLLIIALCTNVFGLHRVYAGRKISAVVGWLLLLCSLIAREYLLWFILPWFLIELIRICRGNYGRLKSNQAFNLHKFKAIVGYKARAKSKAVSSCISVVMAGLILAFVPPAQTVTPDPDITSNYPIIVSQADFAVTTNSTESQVTDDSTTSSTLLTESTAMPELTTQATEVTTQSQPDNTTEVNKTTTGIKESTVKKTTTIKKSTTTKKNYNKKDYKKDHQENNKEDDEEDN